jgi:hypothetical protein
MFMDHETIRLECLKVAASLAHVAPELVEEAARLYASFVLGKGEPISSVADRRPCEDTRHKCRESTSD